MKRKERHLTVMGWVVVGLLDTLATTTTSLRSARDAVADRRSLSISSLMEESLAI